ncbi:TPA: hypothetical protein U1D18_000686 [Streptococcus suis]|nr:hypothetical protein [Streptococcus suis]HEM3716996.1 hypothetical protein [Streptococcus suis]
MAEYWKILKDGSHLLFVIESNLHSELNQSTVNVKVYHKPVDKLNWEGFNYYTTRIYNGKSRRYLSYVPTYSQPTITLSIDSTNYNWAPGDGRFVTEGLYRYYQIYQTDGLLFDKTVTVNHDDDGTKVISVGIKITNLQEKVGDFVVSFRMMDNFALSNAVFSGDLIGNPVIITINRNSNTALHKLYWSFGNLSGTISTNATTSATWTPDIGQLGPQIPNLTSSKAKIRLETYINNRKVGERIYEHILNLPASVKPSLGGLTLFDGNQKANALNLGANTFVQTQSNIRPRFDNVNGVNGSTVVSYRAELQRYVNGNWEATSLSTNTNNGLMGNANFTGRARVVAYVTDSRGRRSDTRTVELTYLPYHVPALSFKGDRVGSGNDRINVTRNIRIAPLTVNNMQKNTGRLTFDVIDVQTNQRTNGVGGSADWTGTTEHEKINWMATLNGTYDVGRTYVVIGQLSDAFNTVTFEYRVGVEAVPASISKFGLAVGKEWSRGVLDVGGSDHLPAYFDCDIYVREKPIQLHQLTNRNGRSPYNASGTIDLNTKTINSFFSCNEPQNGPTVIGSNQFYIAVYSESDNYLSQMAIQKNSGNVYTRTRHAGTWQPWKQLATTDLIGSQKQKLSEDNGVAIQVTGDWNNITSTGFYRGSGLANQPSKAGAHSWYYVRVTGHDTGRAWVLQEAVDFNGVGSWYRVKLNGTWQPWKEYAMASEVVSWTSTGVEGVHYKVNGEVVSLRINKTRYTTSSESMGVIPTRYLPIQGVASKFQTPNGQLNIATNGAMTMQNITSTSGAITQITWQI